MPFRQVTLDGLTIDDRSALNGVAIYGRLETFLQRSGHRFLIPEPGRQVSWDRALFLNLTYWNAEAGGDVLCEDHIPADVVAHVAWHELCSRQLAVASAGPDAHPALPETPPSAAALLFAESIASAFDLYLVGRLLPLAPDSDFIATQVPMMAECAGDAGLSEAAFAALIEEIARAPERAFEDLRALLFDAAGALLACATAFDAEAALERLAGHRFSPLLHHYQLSNWILYARAHAGGGAPDGAVSALDQALREAPVSLDWLDQRWLEPALTKRGSP
jgi:hypothetical protein